MFMICTIVATPVLGQQIMQNNEAVEKQQINTLSYNEYGSFYIEGKTVVTKSSTIYNINP